MSIASNTTKENIQEKELNKYIGGEMISYSGIRLILVLCIIGISFQGCGKPPDPNTRFKVAGFSKPTEGTKTESGSGYRVVGISDSFGGLTCIQKCMLKPITDREGNWDGTLSTESEGIEAKDNEGQLWESREITLEGTKVYAFFKKHKLQDQVRSP